MMSSRIEASALLSSSVTDGSGAASEASQVGSQALAPVKTSKTAIEGLFNVHAHHFKRATDTSGLHLTPDVSLHRREKTFGATNQHSAGR